MPASNSSREDKMLRNRCDRPGHLTVDCRACVSHPPSKDATAAVASTNGSYVEVQGLVAHVFSLVFLRIVLAMSMDAIDCCRRVDR